MQVSTHVKSPKKREEIFKQIEKEYPTSSTDYYLTGIGHTQTFAGKGKAAKIRTIDLGDVSKSRRVDRLESELVDDADKILSVIAEIKEEVEEANKKLPIAKEELKKIIEEIETLQSGFKNFMKKITKDKNLQIEYKTLKGRRKKLEQDIQAYQEIIDNEEKGIDTQLEAYISKKEFIENALKRSETLFEAEKERINILKVQKEKLDNRFENLKENKEVVKQKRTSKIDEMKKRKKQMTLQAIYSFQ